MGRQLDMAQAYHQVPMHSDLIYKTVFMPQDGQYEYTRIPFGLANSPSGFQRIVVLSRLQPNQILTCMDNLLIPNTTATEIPSDAKSLTDDYVSGDKTFITNLMYSKVPK